MWYFSKNRVESKDREFGVKLNSIMPYFVILTLNSEYFLDFAILLS